MKIKLKVFLTLVKYLPPEKKGNEIEVEVEEGTTALQVMERFQIPYKKPLAVAIDQVKLHHDEVGSRPLKENETVFVFPPLSGG